MKAKIEFKILTERGYESLCNWQVEFKALTPPHCLITRLNDLLHCYQKDNLIITYDMELINPCICSQRE